MQKDKWKTIIPDRSHMYLSIDFMDVTLQIKREYKMSEPSNDSGTISYLLGWGRNKHMLNSPPKPKYSNVAAPNRPQR